MAQPFSMRYMLVDGQGNFGSIDGDAPRRCVTPEVHEPHRARLLADIDKGKPSTSCRTTTAPDRAGGVPDPRMPNLLVNGSAGIAVGMATNIPPHNLGEVVDARIALIDDPTLDPRADAVPAGPDFPTAAIINGSPGIRDAYMTGRGRSTSGRAPKSRPTSAPAARPSSSPSCRIRSTRRGCSKDRRAGAREEARGISELRDESDKDGMRMVIELKRGERAGSC